MDQSTLARIRSLVAELECLVAEDQPADTPANVIPIRDCEVELEGIIGRPELKQVKGKTIFTAGLGVKEGTDTQWYALDAWGNVAVAASTLTRGQVVRVVGKPKEVSYVDSYGVLRNKRQLTVSLIFPVSSEITG